MCLTHMFPVNLVRLQNFCLHSHVMVVYLVYRGRYLVRSINALSLLWVTERRCTGHSSRHSMHGCANLNLSLAVFKHAIARKE